MKFIFSILALLLTVKECDQRKSEVKDNKTEIVNNQETAKQQDQDFIINYSAISRGSFTEVSISSSTISMQKDRNSKPEIQSCSSELWSEIMSMVDSLDINTLSKLEAPTQKRLYDGAPHATLKVTVGEKTYQTTSFDHGYPPKEIEPICNLIVELVERKKE